MDAQRITTSLWFDTQAVEAAEFYCSIFEDARIVSRADYPEGTDKAGTPMVVELELLGQRFIAINGGPQFTFNEAISLAVECSDQEEIDRYWERLTDGGEEGACGWLKDRYGLSWQIKPRHMSRFFTGGGEPAARAAQAMFGMRKLDIAALEAAHAGPVHA
ncbi:VOC family protein [Solirubrobacter sp. CPCC 204708]|uniref:VOC family protein n=1 Tax=Solirubrobacter deserti TaxID=2282478 RepID=A0ABT4RJX2_9ACTN|nr:VOC family protein [Solirubrobacter deserti]MBE2319754.1 VOC family protein [Solirubrobacter deserti]MDA0138763.1 VOC family protein [Solirubrobacter deserti]